VKIEKHRLNYIKLGLVCLGIGLLLGTLMAYAATPSSTFTISPGVYPGAPSFTIWKEGSNYFAKDANGKIVYSGTNATQIIQNVIANGISLFFKSGTYLFTSPLSLESNMLIFGDRNAILQIQSGASTPWAIDCFFRGDKIQNTTIRDITLNGNNIGTLNVGILFNATTNCKIENLLLRNWNTRAIYLEGYRDLALMGYRNKVIANHVEKTYAITNAETIVLGGQQDAIIMGNTALYSQHGGITLSVCYNCTVTGNTIRDADGQDVGYGGIDFEQTNASIISSNIICGRSRGVRISFNSSYNTIIGNYISVAKEGIRITDDAGACFANNIVGNTIIGCYDGVLIEDNCLYHSITANLIRDSLYTGIRSHADYTTITGNKIFDSDKSLGGWQNIRLYQADYSVIAGNNVFFTFTTSASNIILLNTTHCVVSNILSYSGRWGIAEEGTADYNNIIGCNCWQASFINIEVVGANTECHLSYNGTSWIP